MISKGDIFALGNLARINVTDQESEELSKDFEKILGYISVIEKAGVEKINPSTLNIARADEVVAFLDSKKVLSSSVGSDGKYIKVKKVLPE